MNLLRGELSEGGLASGDWKAILAMNCDKLRLLEKRRQELLHAVAHEMNDEAIISRCDRLREAAVSVLKKTRTLCHPFQRAENDVEFQEAFLFWQSLSEKEIITITNQWPKTLTYQHVRRVMRRYSSDGPPGDREGD